MKMGLATSLNAFNEAFKFVFTPRYLPKNPHIAYEISVDGSSEFELANPCPPHSAL